MLPARSTAMNQFNQLDPCLGGYGSGDAWSDVGIVVCAEIVERFEAEDWRELAACWHGRPILWQLHCVDVLDGTGGDAHLEQLVQMLLNGPDEVRAHAAVSLANAAPMYWQPGREIHEALRQAKAFAEDDFDRGCIDQLLTRIGDGSMPEAGKGRAGTLAMPTNLSQLPPWIRAAIERLQVADPEQWVVRAIPALGGKSVMDLATTEEGQEILRGYFAKVAGRF